MRRTRQKIRLAERQAQTIANSRSLSGLLEQMASRLQMPALVNTTCKFSAGTIGEKDRRQILADGGEAEDGVTHRGDVIAEPASELCLLWFKAPATPARA
jgi:hypothetical protein